MNSTKQARPTSTPKKITQVGAKLPVSGASRCTPTKKATPSIQNQVPYKAATG